MKKETVEHLLTVAAQLSRDLPGTSAYQWARFVYQANTMAASLQRRYEAACSYAWATTDAYTKRTESLEHKLVRLCAQAGFQVVENWAITGDGGAFRLTDEELAKGTYCALQTDPRGWSLILRFGGRVDRLGGR